MTRLLAEVARADTPSARATTLGSGDRAGSWPWHDELLVTHSRHHRRARDTVHARRAARHPPCSPLFPWWARDAEPGRPPVGQRPLDTRPPVLGTGGLACAPLDEGGTVPRWTGRRAQIGGAGLGTVRRRPTGTTATAATRAVEDDLDSPSRRGRKPMRFGAHMNRREPPRRRRRGCAITGLDRVEDERGGVGGRHRAFAKPCPCLAEALEGLVVEAIDGQPPVRCRRAPAEVFDVISSWPKCIAAVDHDFGADVEGITTAAGVRA